MAVFNNIEQVSDKQPDDVQVLVNGAQFTVTGTVAGSVMVWAKDEAGEWRGAAVPDLRSPVQLFASGGTPTLVGNGPEGLQYTVLKDSGELSDPVAVEGDCATSTDSFKGVADSNSNIRLLCNTTAGGISELRKVNSGKYLARAIPTAPAVRGALMDGAIAPSGDSAVIYSDGRSVSISQAVADGDYAGPIQLADYPDPGHEVKNVRVAMTENSLPVAYWARNDGSDSFVFARADGTAKRSFPAATFYTARGVAPDSSQLYIDGEGNGYAGWIDEITGNLTTLTSMEKEGWNEPEAVASIPVCRFAASVNKAGNSIMGLVDTAGNLHAATRSGPGESWEWISFGEPVGTTGLIATHIDNTGNIAIVHAGAKGVQAVTGSLK